MFFQASSLYLIVFLEIFTINRAMTLFKKNLKERFIINFEIESDLKYVFDNYYVPLCYYASKIVDRDMAKDVVSSVFIKFYEQKKAFSNSDQFLKYIYTSVKNASLDYLKSDQRKDNRENQYALLNYEHGEIEWQELVENEIWSDTYRELNGLPVQCRRVIKLGYLEGLNNSEIADKLDISIQTVKNHKYRGIQILRKKLATVFFLILPFLF